ncbi:hypothetical protein AAXE64_27840 [Priestia megaterium]|uniref:hypothetical protein n=1 Tax=Priestia megaterium TaxID=1404 RepID=UPI003D00ADDD
MAYIKRWTDEEEEYLKAYSAKLTVKELAAELGRNNKAIRDKAKRLGIELSATNGGTHWTDEDVAALEKYWSYVTIEGIAKKLNRTVLSVTNKAKHLGLGSPVDYSIDSMSLSRLSEVVGVDYKTMKEWHKSLGLPAKKQRFSAKRTVLMVKIKDFWKWAEQYQARIDFSKVDKGILLPEPKWFHTAAKHHEKLNLKYKRHKTPWTYEDDRVLRGMCNACKFTYEDISARLLRNEKAIRSRIEFLGIKLKPLTEKKVYPDDVLAPRPKKRWTKEEDQILREMTECQEYTYVDICRKLDRSLASVDSRMRLLKFKQRPLSYVYYSSKEEEMVKEMYGKVPVTLIAEKLGKTCVSINHKISQLKKNNELPNQKVGV